MSGVKHRSFAASGSLTGVNVAFAGKFVDRAAHAKGWYRVTEEECTTGQRPWKIGVDKTRRS